MQNKVPATFTTPGAPTAPDPLESALRSAFDQGEPCDAAGNPTVEPDGALLAAWRDMPRQESDRTPVGQLLNLLGVRVVEADPAELRDGAAASFSGHIGDGVILLSRALAQADREETVRRLLTDASKDGQGVSVTQTCSVYPWCAETGNHTMHASALAEPPSRDGYGDSVLPVNLMAEDDGPFVGWLDLDLTPAQTRERVSELRRHLDIVDGQGPLEPGAECYSVTAPGGEGALISSEVCEIVDPASGGPSHRITVFPEPWMDLELDVAGADQLVADLEQYLPRLRAQRNHLATILGTGAGSSVRATDGTAGHYPWCNTAACITHRYEERDGGGSYVEHVGHETAVTVADGGYAEDAITITVGLGTDEATTSGTQVYLNVGDLDGLAFNPAGVDKLIGQLDTLTAALRTMRSQMPDAAL
ncbi:DUF6907 domain-containing protein [Streptomyces fimicarius]|uniref:DUF6907 domain-containing protein n=1 Tax=Streptomyces griseus TaxID=1911 RepID=UPI003684805D